MMPTSIFERLVSLSLAKLFDSFSLEKPDFDQQLSPYM